MRWNLRCVCHFIWILLVSLVSFGGFQLCFSFERPNACSDRKHQKMTPFYSLGLFLTPSLGMGFTRTIHLSNNQTPLTGLTLTLLHVLSAIAYSLYFVVLFLITEMPTHWWKQCCCNNFLCPRNRMIKTLQLLPLQCMFIYCKLAEIQLVNRGWCQNKAESGFAQNFPRHFNVLK